MRNYASDAVAIAWLGVVSLADGLARGTFVRETRASPSWVYKPTGLGDSVPMFHPDTSGQLELTMDRESREHVILMTLANADRLSRSIVGPMMIRDTNTGLVQLYNKARIQVIPNYTAGTGPSTVTWVFLFAQAVGQTFGADNNTVGS